MISYQRKDRRIYEHSTCVLCGSAYGICTGERKAHQPATCNACGTPQCWTNGMGHGTCSVCYVGLLDRFGERECGYKGCSAKAVAQAPRIGYVCRAHSTRAKQNKAQTVAEYVQAALETRERQWTPVEFEMSAIPVL